MGSASGELEYLCQNHTIGRSSSCQLVLDRSVISVHHATIRWSDGAWTLRDLGSRNGTFLNRRRLSGGAEDWATDLAVGDQIIFADAEETWELVDASEPRPMLLPREPGHVPIRLDKRDMIVLPSVEEPLMTIYQQRGCWQLERDGDCRILQDLEEIVVGERSYRVRLTGNFESTEEADSGLVSTRVEDMILNVQVAPDEESALVVAQVGAAVHELPQRTFLYLLAFLARRRREQAATLGPNAGWVTVETACDELGLKNPEALGLLVYRCRKAIKACGVEDPAAIVDRSRKRQLRIGVKAEQLSITRLE